jgi:hypothetical protein
VGTDDLAVLGIDDQLDDAVAVVVDGSGSDSAELELGGLDVVAGLLGLGLGQADTGYLRLAEGGTGDQVEVERVGLLSGGVFVRSLPVFVGRYLAAFVVCELVEGRQNWPLRPRCSKAHSARYPWPLQCRYWVQLSLKGQVRATVYERLNSLTSEN